MHKRQKIDWTTCRRRWRTRAFVAALRGCVTTNDSHLLPRWSRRRGAASHIPLESLTHITSNLDYFEPTPNGPDNPLPEAPDVVCSDMLAKYARRATGVRPWAFVTASGQCDERLASSWLMMDRSSSTGTGIQVTLDMFWPFVSGGPG
ncbi:hypothetical protein GGX14DRAFT_404474 [Mycena pura]|uniref:Uncharacterized protein n=1 Tax=Mycena pura TaxID=153505 RepID=A0AAD6Y3F5_9AGAR|nr:hypothetical protein GGX14DRAFT_404474 [Mycena pura]